MTSQTTRRSLLDRLKNPQDHAAWREFDDKYRELILRYCLRMKLQQADAEDVRQVVMVAVARGLPRFTYRPELGRFRDYLGAVVRNEIRRHFASQTRDAERLSLRARTAEDVQIEDDPDWNEEWMLHHYRVAMQRVRETFSSQSVDVFDELLHGAPVTDLVERYSMTPEAIYKTKQRIRDRLRECIEQQLREEETSIRQPTRP